MHRNTKTEGRRIKKATTKLLHAINLIKNKLLSMKNGKSFIFLWVETNQKIERNVFLQKKLCNFFGAKIN